MCDRRQGASGSANPLTHQRSYSDLSLIVFLLSPSSEANIAWEESQRAFKVVVMSDKTNVADPAHVVEVRPWLALTRSDPIRDITNDSLVNWVVRVNSDEKIVVYFGN